MISQTMQDPAVSVVIPLYNKGRHIERALRSVLVQSVSTLEVIVVDDGSTDGGPAVVSGINDSRVTLVVQQNTGPGAARNRGIEVARSPWVAFLDADDQWTPRHLEDLLALAVTFPQAGLFATAYQFERDGRCWSPRFAHVPPQRTGGLIEDYFVAAIDTRPVWTSATMVPRRILTEVGGFAEDLSTGQDLDLWARIALYHRVAWHPRWSAIYHLSADNRRAGRERKQDVGLARSIQDYLTSRTEGIVSRESVKEYLVALRLTLAVRLYLQGDRAWAQRLIELTGETQRFRPSRRQLQLLFLVPPAFARLWLNIKRSLRLLSKKIRQPLSTEPR